jgi:hypothetical protein
MRSTECPKDWLGSAPKGIINTCRDNRNFPILLQPKLYQSFANETSLLEDHFGGLGNSSSYVLGDEKHGLQWHIYVASLEPHLMPQSKPTYTLEVCMTELCPAKVATPHSSYPRLSISPLPPSFREPIPSSPR